MFSQQKELLKQAELTHSLAVKKRDAARQRLQQKKHLFLGKPLNLMYPFVAGSLVCASQLKNNAKGLQRIPFFNIAKTGIGLWAMFNRIQRTRKKRATNAEQ